jgi:hypothetical protein
VYEVFGPDVRFYLQEVKHACEERKNVINKCVYAVTSQTWRFQRKGMTAAQSSGESSVMTPSPT